MAEEIEHGTGRGYKAEVDEENRLRTFAISEPLDKHVNVTRGKTWSVYFTITPVGAGDYFFYFKNTGSETLAFTDFRTMCAATETISIEYIVGTPVHTSDTDLVPISRNAGSSQLPSATIKKDTDITGLTSNGVLFFQRLDTGNKMDRLRTTSNIIIPQGGEIAIKAETGTALITMLISLTALD